MPCTFRVGGLIFPPVHIASETLFCPYVCVVCEWVFEVCDCDLHWVGSRVSTALCPTHPGIDSKLSGTMCRINVAQNGWIEVRTQVM